MKDFQTFITEGRDAPLYHGTSTFNARQIIKYNIFEARTQHVGHLLGNPDSPHKNVSKHPIPERNTYNGVSFSRNFEKSKSFGDIVFEVDQSKLVQNYKIRPVQWFSSTSIMRNARTSKYAKIGMSTESEEFVLGSIKNADKYITAIWFPDDDERYRIHNPDILSHPLAKPYTSTFR